MYDELFLNTYIKFRCIDRIICFNLPFCKLFKIKKQIEYQLSNLLLYNYEL